MSCLSSPPAATSPLQTALKGLSPSQLIGVIEGLVHGHPDLEKVCTEPDYWGYKLRLDEEEVSTVLSWKHYQLPSWCTRGSTVLDEFLTNRGTTDHESFDGDS